MLNAKFSMQKRMDARIASKELDKTFYDLFCEYYKIFGFDNYIESRYEFFADFEPRVAIIVLDGIDSARKYVKEQIYKNVDLCDIREKTCMDLIQQSSYVVFFETDYEYGRNRIADAVLSLMTSADDACIHYRNFKLPDQSIVKDVTFDYYKGIGDKSFIGAELLKICIENNINLYGGVSVLTIKASFIKRNCPCDDDVLERMKFFMEILDDANVHFLNRVYSIKKVCRSNDNLDLNRKKYTSYITEYANSHKLKVQKKDLPITHIDLSARSITFFYSDNGEYYNLKPIADEAYRRGYTIRFTKDLHERAEVGIYCQHVCYPENAKFSIVLLHDMAQRHDIWPNIWGSEHWDHFDIGILPGNLWGNRWRDCAFIPYARPRLGVYMLGYPKGDIVHSEEIREKAEMIKKRFKYSFSVLYAPSWENDGKEDDFVKALAGLPVNLIIKQGQPNEDVLYMIPDYEDNLQQMRDMHEGKYDNLLYIEPEENIFVALQLCDVAVSDESSIMTENLLYGKPSIAVTDWLIPDRTPHRPAVVPYNYVCKIKKEKLRETIIDMVNDHSIYDKYVESGKGFFANIGNTSADILDLIEYYTNDGNKLDERISRLKLESKYECIDMWN